MDIVPEFLLSNCLKNFQIKFMFDIVIIGAGVIGLAIAKAIGNNSNKSVLVIEKEETFGRGISSRNSEVIHSGIYYEPNSLKAKYCIEGRELLYDYCKESHVWIKRCGKIIVGSNHQESDLENLFKNGKTNSVPDLKIIDKKEINLLESNIDADIGLYVGCAGILSAHELMLAYYRESQLKNHDYLFKSKLVGAKQINSGYELDIENPLGESETVSCEWVINSAGLESDIIAELIGNDFPKLKYSKGCYFKLSPKWRSAFKRLIYPLPDKEHGTLGIHLSFDQNNSVKLGPSAHWLENKIEDYDIDEKLIDQFYNEGKLYIKNLQKDDLSPDYSGIRPKINIDNNPMPDFYIEHEESKGLPGWINLIGIESPGITASIAIGNKISKIVN